MALPRFFAMISDEEDEGKHLRFVKEDLAELHGFLKLTRQNVQSPLSKYEVTIAKCGNGLVHIKCCYNNKYWRRSSEKHSWIVAGANEPEEDHTKWSCTLFEPIVVALANDKDLLSYRFRHVQLKHYVSVYYEDVNPDDPYNCCIESKSGDGGTNDDIFNIIDWETLIVFPKHVTFMGPTCLYLETGGPTNENYLQFSAQDPRDPAGDEIFHDKIDGSIRIRNIGYGKFWRRNDDDWILADADKSGGLDIYFVPVKVDDDTIALYNEGNGMYLRRFSTDGITSCLSASDPEISSCSEMKVTEDVVYSTNIDNVNYHLMDERIYDKTPVALASTDVVNDTRQNKHIEVKLKYTDNWMWSWSSNVSSISDYIKSKITAGIPKIVGEKTEICGNFSGHDYKWGKMEEKETTVEVVHHVTVPPMTKTTVKLRASKGSCDIPFSYTRHDILWRRTETTIYDVHDGIYTCSNFYDFHYETFEESINN